MKDVLVNIPLSKKDKSYKGLIKLNIVAKEDSVVAVKVNNEFVTDLELAIGDTWICLNSHLLPNGKNIISFSKGGSTKELEITVGNNSELAKKVKEELQSIGSKLIYRDIVDNSLFNKKLKPWFERDDAQDCLTEKLEKGLINKVQYNQLQSFFTEGYIVIPNAFSEKELLDANSALDDISETNYKGYQYGTSKRVNGAHQDYSALYNLWKHPKVYEILKLIYEEEPLACQSLTYVFGSQQDLHQDTTHLSSFPEGYMCGVWIALEDIKEGSGELEYVPGSHKYPRVFRKDVGCKVVRDNDWSEFLDKVEGEWVAQRKKFDGHAKQFLAKKGDLLIWHENLMHGGAKRLDMAQSRRSFVSHYYADGAIAYYDSLGLPGFID